MSALNGFCQWLLYRSKPIYPLMVGVGAAVSTVAIGTSIAQAARQGLSQESILFAIGLICFLIAAAIYAADARTRIHTLQADLIDKDGYKHFVEHAAEGFYRTALDGRIIEINGALAQIYGYDSQQALLGALNENSEAFYIDQGRRNEFLAQMRTQGRLDEFISKVCRRDGKTIWIVENARAVHSADSKFLYCEGTVHDITVQRESLQAMGKALNEAREAARAKAAFIAAMSHELKTPLNAVLGFSELMLHEPAGQINERYRAYLTDIHSNGKRLLDLICDVIDFARIEGHALELTECIFPIDQVIQAARETVLKSHPAAPAIIVRMPLQMPLVRGDPKRVSQAIANILSNAVKFTPTDGSVSVSGFWGPDGSFVVEIADTGIGMAPERIAAALEPFRQIDQSVARRFEGLGLGLSLAQGLIRLHDGRLAIASTVNKGTVVNIAFPPERVVLSAGQMEPATPMLHQPVGPSQGPPLALTA